MKNKKKVKLFIISLILIIAILISIYMLLIMPKQNKETTKNETLNLEQEKVESQAVSVSNWNLERVNIVNDESGVPVPVPKGYVASGLEDEKTVNTGFVIYEGEEAVTEENKEEAQKTRNQWVWVPIYDLSEIYGIDSNGMMHGKLYDYNAEGRTALNWTENDGVMSVTNTTGYPSNREPDILIYYDTNSKLPNYMLETGRNDLNRELTEEFENTIESIEKYGGFYIGRYETGGLNGDAKVVRGEENISNQNWYTMYKKCKTLNGTNENVTTNMIWGSLWDATLEWLVESGSKTYSEVGKDSKSWGNYWNSPVSGHGRKRPAGYREEWKANNIYDMAGNVHDMTLEANSTGNRVLRGSYYESQNYHYSVGPADYRNLPHEGIVRQR